MTQAEEKKIKNEVAELKRFRDFIIQHFHLEPKAEELEIAVAALMAGDKSALESYIQRGGKIANINQS
jgi:hypothetical protein